MERELWTLLYSLVDRLDKKQGSWKFSAGDIVIVYLWSVMHDRPMCWAINKNNWPDDLRPCCLPSQSTESRRMRSVAVRQLMIAMEESWLALAGACAWWMRVIDGKPLAVSGVSKDRDAGYGRGAGGLQKGYKLHVVWAGGPLPIAWGLAPMNVSEKTMARHLIPTLPGEGYLLGDAEFDSNPLFDLAHQAGYQLLARKRQKQHGVGHRRQSPYRLRSIELLKTTFGKYVYRFRRQIERDLGELTSFGGGLTCLPPWARRFHRVLNWVHAKLLTNAARWLCHQHDPLALA
jgi:hypothetical protein